MFCANAPSYTRPAVRLLSTPLAAIVRSADYRSCRWRKKFKGASSSDRVICLVRQAPRRPDNGDAETMLAMFARWLRTRLGIRIVVICVFAILVAMIVPDKITAYFIGVVIGIALALSW